MMYMGTAIRKALERAPYVVILTSLDLDKLSMVTVTQANIRRTNVATKLKVTYLKDEYLDVRSPTVLPSSSSSHKVVLQVKIQYKACVS